MTHWWLVVGMGMVTLAFKATGPVILGGRELPAPAARVLSLLAPTLLAGLVVTQTITKEGAVLDPRLAGVAVAAVALWRRLPTLAVVVIAAAAAAALRALTG